MNIGSPARVLVEDPDETESGHLFRILTDHGYDVSWCPGPEGPASAWCPLMSGAECDLVSSADVVVSCLGFGHETCRGVVASLPPSRDGKGVVVVATPGDERKWASLLKGSVVLRPPLAEREVLKAVAEASRNSSTT
jgi:hypothetical protein